ncbi:hypothetical protein DFH09DRAFT_1279470 [Mycena vulgaris]|nr:hypothetical protein DFH09DRAFT_1279470 [Mycena vulgaris]
MTSALSTSLPRLRQIAVTRRGIGALANLDRRAAARLFWTWRDERGCAGGLTAGTVCIGSTVREPSSVRESCAHGCVFRSMQRLGGLLAARERARHLRRRMEALGLFSTHLEQQPARTRGVNLSSFGDNDDGHWRPRDILRSQGYTGAHPARHVGELGERRRAHSSQLRRAHVSVQILVHYGSPLAHVPVQATPAAGCQAQAPHVHSRLAHDVRGAARRGFDPTFHALSMMGGDAGWTFPPPPRLAPNHLAASLRSRR